jgi:drug/metabolite transporter (DMT)-like permease
MSVATPNLFWIGMILFTVTTNAAAQILLKTGMKGLSGLTLAPERVVQTVLTVVFNPFVFAGLCMFVVSMASHLAVLSKVELSFAYPFLSLAYVIVTAWAFFVFGENVTALRVAGVALICLGTVLIANS